MASPDAIMRRGLGVVFKSMENSSRTRARTAMQVLVRVALASGLLYIVFHGVSLAGVVGELRSAHFASLLPAIALQIISLYVAAHRWRLFLRDIEPAGVSVWTLWAENLIGVALNSLPTGMLGDLARARRM